MTKGTIKDVRLWLARLAGRTLPTSQVGEFVDRLIHDKMHALNDATKHLAEVAMNRSVQAALSGRNVNEM